MGRKSDREQRERIVAVAGDVIALHGLKGMSIKDIARAAGLKKVQVKDHYDSKDAIYAAVIRPLAESLIELDENLAELRPPVKAGTDDLNRWRRAAAAGLVDLVVMHRTEFAILLSDLPGVIDHPEFADLHFVLDRTLDALMGDPHGFSAGTRRVMTCDRIRAEATLFGLAGIGPTLPAEMSNEELRKTLLSWALHSMNL